MSSNSQKPSSGVFILVFAEDENQWVSLIEANRKVIEYWKTYETADLRLEILNLSQSPVSLKKFLAAPFVVISKITRTTAELVKKLREFHPDSRIIFHGFESSSLFFANTHLYGLEPFLKSRDLWLMSCEADEVLAHKSWKNIKTHVVPLATAKESVTSHDSARDLVFFGRISTQKNLHEAFYALYLIQNEFRTQNRRFKIFGYEDHLGVPHFAVPGRHYLIYLKRLVRKLGIADLVEFHPFISEDEIDRELTTGILLSPSIHSDENFGLVAFRALSQGHKAILTYWGGHKDYTKSFSQVSYVRVFETKNGLHINPFELSRKMMDAFSKKTGPTSPQEFPIIPLRMEGDEPLVPTELKIGFNQRLKGLKAWPYYGKLFKNYTDPLFLMASRAYGSIERPLRPRPESTVVLPTVTINREWLILSDVRSKRLKLRRTPSEHISLKQLGSRRSVRLSITEWQWLWENGGVVSKDVE